MMSGINGKSEAGAERFRSRVGLIPLFSVSEAEYPILPLRTYQ